MCGTGTWLGAMAHGLLGSNEIELGIIAPGPDKHFIRSDYRQVKQWLVPSRPLGRDGLPPTTLIQSIVAAVNEYAPDVIHIWGTEGWWGLLTARGLLEYPALLEMQGLKGEIAKVFYGGLTLSERLSCIGIKEVLKRRTMHADRRDCLLSALREAEIIQGHRFVGVQTQWLASHVKVHNPDVQLVWNDFLLRQPFYDSNGWQGPSHPTLFYTASYTSPFKGLHLVVRALALLRTRIPSARLRIAGAHQRVGIRQDGYMRWINQMIREFGLEDAIEWLGPINGAQIIKELESSAAAVIPTYVEGYCLAFAEAMILGTPTVVAYAGGTSYLGKDEESCLFFFARRRGDVRLPTGTSVDR